MEHKLKQTLTDRERLGKFIAYHTGIGTRIVVENSTEHEPIRVRAFLANVLGPDATWMTCAVLNGIWNFQTDRATAKISHEHLYTHGILGVLSY